MDLKKRTPSGKGGNLKESESVWVLLILYLSCTPSCNIIEFLGYKSVQFLRKIMFREEMSQNFNEAFRWA